MNLQLSLKGLLLTVLLIASYCESVPVEPTKVDSDESATICPEELAQKKLHSFNENLEQENSHLDELEKEKTEEKINNNLHESPVNTREESDAFKFVKETVDANYPEVEEDKPAENIADSQDNQQENTENTNEVTSEIITVCPEEVENNKPQKNSSENLKNFQDNLQKDTGDSNLEKIKHNLKETQEKTTIIYPEKHENKKLENNSDLDFQKHQHTLEQDSDPTNSIQNEEDMSANIEETDNLDTKKQGEEQNQNLAQEESVDTKPIKSTEHSKETATELSNQEELQKTELEKLLGQASADRFQTDYDNDISKSLEYLTKYKALVSKVQKEKSSRIKRQTSDYSSYYGNQQNYNQQASSYSNQNQQGYPPQGYNSQAVSKSNAYNQRRPSYNPQGDLSSTNPRVKTYQQLRRQQSAQNVQKAPSYYPKSYQNSGKPVKTYRNPSTYVRYPSNGKVKSYRSNPTASRRQFQGAGQQFTTTRPTARVTRKKFRPSPVFA